MKCNLTLPRMVNFSADNLTAPSGDVHCCPWCGFRMGVKESRITNSFGPILLRRTRHCAKCKGQVSTVEVQVSDLLVLLSKYHEEDVIDKTISYLEGLRVEGRDFSPGPIAAKEAKP